MSTTVATPQEKEEGITDARASDILEEERGVCEFKTRLLQRRIEQLRDQETHLLGLMREYGTDLDMVDFMPKLQHCWHELEVANYELAILHSHFYATRPYSPPVLRTMNQQRFLKTTKRLDELKLAYAKWTATPESRANEALRAQYNLCKIERFRPMTPAPVASS
jgi:hypothetical protein